MGGAARRGATPGTWGAARDREEDAGARGRVVTVEVVNGKTARASSCVRVGNWCLRARGAIPANLRKWKRTRKACAPAARSHSAHGQT